MEIQVALGLGSNRKFSLEDGATGFSRQAESSRPAESAGADGCAPGPARTELSCVELLAGAVSALGGILNGIKFSSVYKTRAMYVTDQDDFYNIALTGYLPVVGGNSAVDAAYDLLDEIHLIEARFGRSRKNEIRFGPRTLDIDIELFGAHKIRDIDLTVPHARLEERAFVLVPLVEILANSADNINGKDLNKFDSALIESLIQREKELRAAGERENAVEKFLDSESFAREIHNGRFDGKKRDAGRI